MLGMTLVTHQTGRGRVVRRLLIEREHRLDSLQLSAALFAGGQVLGNCRSLFGDSLTVSITLLPSGVS